VTVTVIEPARPTHDEVEAELRQHIAALAGEGAEPRPEQLAAVQAVVADRRRTLLVARTGFGKSAVYFSATRMLRDRGWGPTLVVSPLLALMRDQVAAAKRLGLSAETINSSNTDDWDEIEDRITAGQVDLLLISPERLANDGFRERVFDLLQSQPMALVCDEAHCISDWGHDFRPDYLRLRRIIDELPAWTPVLATTATANQRVTDDVAAQLGDDTLVQRTSLDRASLHLSVVELTDDAERLAWLAEKLPDIDGSGIIYCLTVDQAERTAAWLQRRGMQVEAYTGSTDPTEREGLEDRLRTNDLKALVATSALGMGFDKGDMAFCVHLGLPPTPVAYYQQIGRAGRAIDHAEVIAVPRPVEDAAVWNWFEKVSLPPESTCQEVLTQLSTASATSINRLEAEVNLGRTRLMTLLKILEVDEAIAKVAGGWVITDPAWRYDHDKADRLRALRREESEQMLAYAGLDECRLRFVRESLDDAEAADCGRCDRCLGSEPPVPPSSELVEEARRHLAGADVEVEPRKQWPSGLDEPKGRIKPDRQARRGRALSRLGDGALGAQVDALLDGSSRELSPAILRGLIDVLRRWDWEQRPTWVCPMPSRSNQQLIDVVADTISKSGKMPVVLALVRVDDGGGAQADQSNSAHQVANVWGRLAIDPAVDIPDGPVLLIDDQIQSGWTMTIAAALLAEAGVDSVLPLALRSR
jgi:ATP-dependent DNA helicase RecQ